MAKVITLKIIVDQKNATKRTTQLTQEISKLQAKQKALNKQNKGDAINNKLLAKSINDTKIKLQQKRAELTRLNKTSKLTSGSLGALRARNARLATIINKVNIETKTGKARFRTLSQEMGRNQTKINKLDASMKRFRGNVGNYSGGIKSAFAQIGLAIAGVMMAFRTLDRLFVGSMKKFDMQAKSVAKVAQAIKSTNEAARLSIAELTAEASKLQQETLFGDETILNNATAQLLTFTNIFGENFLRTQEIAMDLSTVLDTTGDGTARLKDVSIQLGKALNDPVRNLSALGRAGIQFSKEQIKVIKHLSETNHLAEAQTMILDELERQYGGQAKAAVVGIGAFQQLGNTMGDLQEGFGSLLSDALTPLAKGLTEFLTITHLQSEQIQVEQFQLNNLVDSITGVNTTQESRNRLITELQKKYPDFLSNLDSEKVTNEELKDELILINDEYEKKIKLLIAQELYTKASKELAELYFEETELIKKLDIAQNKLDRTMKGMSSVMRGGGDDLIVLSRNVRDYTSDLENNRNEQIKINDTISETIGRISILKDELSEMPIITTKAPQTISEYIAEHEEEFEAWKIAREQYLRNQELFDLATKKKIKEEYKIKTDDFEMEEEEDIADFDPALSREGMQAYLTYQYELDLYQKTADGRKAILDKLLADNKISELQYRHEINKIDFETWKSRLEVAEWFFSGMQAMSKKDSMMYKFAAAGQARIAGALAIMRIWAGQITSNPIIDAVIKGILTGVQIGVTETQVAKINKEKFSKGEILQGKSHEQGGIPFSIGGRTGFEAEGGEAIINKQSTALFRDELSAINSYNGYGKRFAAGGYVPYTPTPRGEITNNMIQETIRESIEAVGYIPVVVAENEITQTQRHVQVIEAEGDL